MEYANPQALVSAEWLNEHLGDDNLRVIDATYHLPHDERDAFEEYTFRHIPGATHFNIDEICAEGTGLPHMLPSAETFAAAVGARGIDNTCKVIVYDTNGGYMAATRLWWMFRLFGHEDVAMLDGGLRGWSALRAPLEQDEANPEPATFTATKNEDLVRDADQMLANITSAAEQVLDARSPGRYSGVDHEPRPTERRGHIPGSHNLPFPKLMDMKNGFTLRSADEIKAAFDETGTDLSKPLTATCGSGVTACVVAFAAYLLGKDDVAVYDGSWAEWGDRPDLPIGS